MLFLTIILLSFFLAFAKNIIKLLNVSKLFVPNQVKVPPGLEEDLRQARADLQQVKNSGPGSEEYAFFIKTMRAERKVKDLEQQILSERKVGHFKGASVELLLYYVVKTILYVTLLTISIRNRYNPVLIFAEQYNFEPLQGLITFPTGIPNAVSVPIWVLSCNVTFRMISGLTKKN